MDRVKEYDRLKGQLESGELTAKGFDSRVKELLVKETGEKSGEGSNQTKDYLTAAEAFAKAKNLMQPLAVKKKQHKLAAKPASQIKIKLSPMEWRPRTATRSGKFYKMILEEIPPRITMMGHETYDDLLKIGSEKFWPGRCSESEFTLCHPDGTRWTVDEFLKEFKTVSDITTPWKRTIYIGRKELDVVCVDDDTPDEEEDKDGVHGRWSFEEDSSSSAGLGAAQQLSQLRVNSESAPLQSGGDRPETSQKQAVERRRSSCKRSCSGQVKASTSSSNPIVPSLYLPRVPYVDCSLINFDEGVLLGQGTFGNVYGGSFQGTPAAIKKIMLGGAKDTEHDIHHEINVSLRLSHPNIVRLLAAARTETYFLLATEYIHGAPLDVVIHSDSSIVKLEGQDDDFIALDLAMAMEYIHGQKVIHQDIKPANVMVHLQAKRAVLTDWGLANIRDTVQLRQGSRLQAQGVGPIGGTYLYMAPECILHFEEASYWTDMWSLGATYVELFTRSGPWVVKKQRELSALMAANMPPHAVDKLDERYQFLRLLLSYEPQSRPTASDVVHFLKSGLGLDLEGWYGYKW